MASLAEADGADFEFRREDVEAAIAAHPRQAELALAMIQAGRQAPVTLAGLRGAADVLGRADFATFFYEQLRAKGLVRAFGLALRSEGVDVGMPAHDYSADHSNPKALARFACSATAFRCRIEVNGAIVGSGCLVGPSSVLTAWHVVAVAAPGQPQDPLPNVRVLLSDGSFIEACLPSDLEYPCGDLEYGRARLPDTDDLLEGRHDLVLLRLKRPAALHLGAARLPDKPPSLGTASVIYLVHFPRAQDVGYGQGAVSPIPGLRRRWEHDVTSDAGSSGGGCFDRHFHLVGIHQGRWDASRRLVPLGEVLDELRDRVANDLMPTLVWSLDGRLDGRLVLGRDEFFLAVAEIAKGGPGARGLRIKRTDAAGGVTGLAFSFELLRQMLSRQPQVDFLVRVGFDTVIDDLPNEILRRARQAGLQVDDVAAEPGVAEGETAPEAVEADRGRRAARLLDAAAAASGRAAWIFIEHPSVAFGEKLRYALEAFIDQALRMPALRLVIAGYEAVALPGQEYQTLDAARRATAPGMLVEYLRGISRQDVVNLLTRSADALRLDVDPGWAEGAADGALIGLQAKFGQYSLADVLAIVDRCRHLLGQQQPRGDQ